jgi:hypothetical protein
MVARFFFAALVVVAFTAAGRAQTPQPFPRAGAPPQQQRPAPVAAPPATTPQRPPVADSSTPAAGAKADPGAPTAELLGVAVYPGAQFLSSYDAGRGQRYYLFGTTSDFAQTVTFYRNVLKQRGELVYEEPPIHMFDVGRYREETMAFPPGVTVKDYTWAGSAGYLNPKRGVEPARFRTIVQIVPAPALGSGGR